jgi:phosphate transport system substrate-binding protein
MQGWTAGYSGVQPGRDVNYDPVGSGGGREQFIAAAPTSPAPTPRSTTEELAAAQERCAGGEVFELPNYISPIAVVYNLEGVDELNLSPEVSPASSTSRSPTGTTRRSPPTTPA